MVQLTTQIVALLVHNEPAVLERLRSGSLGGIATARGRRERPRGARRGTRARASAAPRPTPLELGGLALVLGRGVGVVAREGGHARRVVRVLQLLARDKNVAEDARREVAPVVLVRLQPLQLLGHGRVLAVR